ncbi:MAG: S8 family serine peptidase [Gammaproteobacteria bacterium]
MAIRRSIIWSLGVLLTAGSLSVNAAVNTAVTLKSKVEPVSIDTDSTKKLYIVQLDQAPALGSVSRYDEFDPTASRVLQQVYKLRERQDQLLLSINATDDDVYRYTYAFNGMAVMLSQDQVAELRKRKGVTRVSPDRRRMVSTNKSVDFLGLRDAATGLQTARGLTGENVVIGMIDSGIAPDHPSLNDEKPGKEMPRLCRSEWAENSLLGLFLCRVYKSEAKPTPLYDPPTNWRGTCQTGPGFPSGSCNNKLIGARFFREGANRILNIDAAEFNSPADADGHGTHLATIAAGNAVSATVLDRKIGTVQGMAPRARVAVYKACWVEEQASRALCSTADLVNAIEAAVADGVDIINFSIGDRDGSVSNPDDLALLAAAEAGVLTVVAAGNDGPDLQTVQSPGSNPWVITVGATSQPGTIISQAVQLTSPASLAGNYASLEASFTPQLQTTGARTGRLTLVNDATIETPEGAIGSLYDGCSSLDPASLTDQIALIERGGCNFDLKVRNAQQAGAFAVVVYNNDQNLITMAGSSSGILIPAVMITQADGQLILDKLFADEIINITLDSNLRIDVVDEGNLVARFSSRGPDFDFLKPDVVAPGKNIVGGHTRQPANSKPGEEFQYLSGTSQSVPHVAGVAALIKQARQGWSPAQIKSALMTTSRQNIEKNVLDEDGFNTGEKTLADPLDIGAGHIVPNNAVEPGLLYNVDINEYDAYLCANAFPRLTNAECETLFAQGYGVRAENINLPSVYVTELVASRTVTRKVTNTGASATYIAEWEMPGGIGLSVEPDTLSLGNGKEGTFTLTFNNLGAAEDEVQLGYLTWSSSSQTVYSPLAVLPSTQPLSVTEFIGDEGAAGSRPLALEFGYDGEYNPVSSGLHLPCVLPDSTDDDDQCVNVAPATVQDAEGEVYALLSDEDLPDSIRRFYFEVDESDNRYLRVATYDAYTDGNDDLDLYLYYCVEENDDNVCVKQDPIGIGLEDDIGQSQGLGTATEIIELENPAPGAYIVDVHGAATDEITGGAGAAFRLYAWSFGDQVPGSNLTLSDVPAGAVKGTAANMTANWSGLTTGLWLGGIIHNDEGGWIGQTIVEIDVDFFTAE